MTPAHHDVLVALVSHVPQLAASTLMDVATDHEEEHRTLLRLAAGGFRDMTRIAAGHPGIWPDILAANRDAVLDALDAYLDALQHARDLVAGADRDGLLGLLERARSARRNLPMGISVSTDLVELRIPVPDRPGVIAEVTTLAGRARCQRRRLRDRALARGWRRCHRDGRRRRGCRRRSTTDCTRSATTPAARSCRERVRAPGRARVRRRAPVARAGAGARRQVDLAPRAAVRRDRERPQHADAPRDR